SNFLGKISNLKPQIDDGFLSNGQSNSRLHGSPETRLLGTHFLQPDRQRKHSVTSSLVRCYRSQSAGFEILYIDDRAADSRAGGILHSSGNRRGHLSPRQLCAHDENQNPQSHPTEFSCHSAAEYTELLKPATT